MSAVAFSNSTATSVVEPVVTVTNCSTGAGVSTVTDVVSSTAINATTVWSTAPCDKCEHTAVPVPSANSTNGTVSATPSVPQTNGAAGQVASFGSVVAVVGGLLLL